MLGVGTGAKIILIKDCPLLLIFRLTTGIPGLLPLGPIILSVSREGPDSICAVKFSGFTRKTVDLVG